MWACVSAERLKLLHAAPATCDDLQYYQFDADGADAEADDGGAAAAAARATAHVGNALTRILALVGRVGDAARAAEATIRACETLGARGTDPAAVAHCLTLRASTAPAW